MSLVFIRIACEGSDALLSASLQEAFGDEDDENDGDGEASGAVDDPYI